MGGKVSRIADGIGNTIKDVEVTVQFVQKTIDDLRQDARGAMANISKECIESIIAVREQGIRTIILLTDAVSAVPIALVLGLLLHLSQFSQLLRLIVWIMYAVFGFHLLLTYVRHSRQSLQKPEETPHRNVELEETITKYGQSAAIDLTGLKLRDEDMSIVVNRAVTDQQCSSLRCVSNGITSHGAEIFAQVLLQNQTLEQLSFWKNQLSDAGVRFLCEKLSINRGALSKLDLSDNLITDTGAGHLANMLTTNQILTRLSLSDNQITDVGVRSLAYALQHRNRTLQKLSLTGNKQVTDACLGSLVDMIKKNRSLQALWINDCGLSESSKERLRKVAKSKEDFSCYV